MLFGLNLAAKSAAAEYTAINDTKQMEQRHQPPNVQPTHTTLFRFAPPPSDHPGVSAQRKQREANISGVGG